jgi:hypothetical protein
MKANQSLKKETHTSKKQHQTQQLVTEERLKSAQKELLM